MLPHTSILDALIRLKLMEPSERPSFTELHGGISSEIYKIDLKLGPVCAKRALPTLKSDPDWHVPVERSAAEWEWFSWPDLQFFCLWVKLFHRFDDDGYKV